MTKKREVLSEKSLYEGHPLCKGKAHAVSRGGIDNAIACIASCVSVPKCIDALERGYDGVDRGILACHAWYLRVADGHIRTDPFVSSLDQKKSAAGVVVPSTRTYARRQIAAKAFEMLCRKLFDYDEMEAGLRRHQDHPVCNAADDRELRERLLWFLDPERANIPTAANVGKDHVSLQFIKKFCVEVWARGDGYRDWSEQWQRRRDEVFRRLRPKLVRIMHEAVCEECLLDLEWSADDLPSLETLWVILRDLHEVKSLHEGMTSSHGRVRMLTMIYECAVEKIKESKHREKAKKKE